MASSSFSSIDEESYLSDVIVEQLIKCLDEVIEADNVQHCSSSVRINQGCDQDANKIVSNESKSVIKKGKKFGKAPKTSIVCTRLHREEVAEFAKIVKTLGKFYVKDKVSSNTTHIIVGDDKRTINVLRAVSRGCWVLKAEWLQASLEEGKWLPEAAFEFTEFSPAVQECRQKREVSGSSYSMDIFQNTGSIYVSRNSSPSFSDLEELVVLCKGKITNARRRAAIVVGEFIDSTFSVCVTEKWVLDSVMLNKKQSFENFMIQRRASICV